MRKFMNFTYFDVIFTYFKMLNFIKYALFVF